MNCNGHTCGMVPCDCDDPEVIRRLANAKTIDQILDMLVEAARLYRAAQPIPVSEEERVAGALKSFNEMMELARRPIRARPS